MIPWCVPPTNTYPHPGHVLLGITSPLLLESSGPFPVDLVSPPFSLDIVLYPLYSHLQVPTLSLSVLISHFDMMSQIFFLGHLLRCLVPSCGICISFLQRILAHQNFGGVRNLNQGRRIPTTKARLCVCRRSRHGRNRLFAFNLSLLRQRQQFQENRISPFSQPLQYHSNPQTTLSLIPEISQRNTLNTRAHVSDRKTDRPRK